MAFISTIKPSESSGDVRKMYERQQSVYGYVPNYAKVFSHRPEVLARWGRLLAEIRRPMSDRLFELATFAAAMELKNTACSLAHGQKLAEFIGAEAVGSLAKGESDRSISDAEATVLVFARKVASDASQVEPEDVEQLRRHGYSDAEIFDIATTVAGRSFLTKLLDALGVEMDVTAKDLSRELTDNLVVGRPISDKAPEAL